MEPQLLHGRYPVDINGLSSSFSFLLCHSNAETAQIVIIDELDSGLFKCRLNFDQIETYPPATLPDFQYAEWLQR
jgi:hypothetical protein